MSTRTPAQGPTGRHRSRSARTVTPSFRLRVALPIVSALYVAALGAVGASAASLGGASTADLGAASATVASHTSGITVQWMPASSGQDFVLDGITLGTVGSDRFVAGERLRVAIVGTAGSALCELSVVNPALSATLAIGRSQIDSACGSAGIAFSAIDRVAVSAGS